MFRPKKLLPVFLGLVLGYVLLVFLIPPDPAALEKYNISAIGLRMLSLSFVVPVIGIWFAAFYGYMRFKDYAELVKQSPDGKGYSLMANGLGILALGLPVTSILTTLFSYINRQSPANIRVTTIISNYLSIIIAFGAFYFIHKGAQLLTSILGKKKTAPSLPTSTTMLFGLFALAYTYVTLQNPIRNSADSNKLATHYLPDWLIIATIVLPYLYIWFLGVRSVYYLKVYQSCVKGVIYRHIFKLLSYGIGATVLASVLVQALMAFSAQLQTLALIPLLMVIYLLLIAISAGYILIALGANKLKKIEEV